jgi:prepilin-type N-terminal cleavage/methylation domain-containing protein
MPDLFPSRSRYHSLSKGLTLVEVLITVAILSVGIIAIFQSFFVSLNQIVHLTNRLYVTTNLDNRICLIERMLRAYKTLPFDMNQDRSMSSDNNSLKYKPFVSYQAVEDFPDVFKMDVSVSWKEQNIDKHLSRSAYILDFNYFTP